MAIEDRAINPSSVAPQRTGTSPATIELSSIAQAADTVLQTYGKQFREDQQEEARQILVDAQNTQNIEDTNRILEAKQRGDDVMPLRRLRSIEDVGILGGRYLRSAQQAAKIQHASAVHNDFMGDLADLEKLYMGQDGSKSPDQFRGDANKLLQRTIAGLDGADNTRGALSADLKSVLAATAEKKALEVTQWTHNKWLLDTQAQTQFDMQQESATMSDTFLKQASSRQSTQKIYEGMSTQIEDYRKRLQEALKLNSISRGFFSQQMDKINDQMVSEFVAARTEMLANNSGTVPLLMDMNEWITKGGGFENNQVAALKQVVRDGLSKAFGSNAKRFIVANNQWMGFSTAQSQGGSTITLKTLRAEFDTVMHPASGATSEQRVTATEQLISAVESEKVRTAAQSLGLAELKKFERDLLTDRPPGYLEWQSETAKLLRTEIEHQEKALISDPLAVGCGATVNGRLPPHCDTIANFEIATAAIEKAIPGTTPDALARKRVHTKTALTNVLVNEYDAKMEGALAKGVDAQRLINAPVLDKDQAARLTQNINALVQNGQMDRAIDQLSAIAAAGYEVKSHLSAEIFSTLNEANPPQGLGMGDVGAHFGLMAQSNPKLASTTTSMILQGRAVTPAQATGLFKVFNVGDFTAEIDAIEADYRDIIAGFDGDQRAVLNAIVLGQMVAARANASAADVAGTDLGATTVGEGLDFDDQVKTPVRALLDEVKAGGKALRDQTSEVYANGMKIPTYGWMGAGETQLINSMMSTAFQSASGLKSFVGHTFTIRGGQLTFRNTNKVTRGSDPVMRWDDPPDDAEWVAVSAQVKDTRILKLKRPEKAGDIVTVELDQAALEQDLKTSRASDKETILKNYIAGNVDIGGRPMTPAEKEIMLKDAKLQDYGHTEVEAPELFEIRVSAGEKDKKTTLFKSDVVKFQKTRNFKAAWNASERKTRAERTDAELNDILDNLEKFRARQ